MCLGELVNAYFCHLQRVYEVGIEMHVGAKRARESAALERQLRAVATADVRAATGPALRRVGLDAAACHDEALQVGLRRVRPTAHAAPPGHRYEEASTSSASSDGTSTGATALAGSASASATTVAIGSSASASGVISSVGWLASAWWESRPQ